MDDYLFKACEEIDAGMFSADTFIDEENRETLKRYMARWQRELILWEEQDKERENTDEEWEDMGYPDRFDSVAEYEITEEE